MIFVMASAVMLWLGAAVRQPRYDATFPGMTTETLLVKNFTFKGVRMFGADRFTSISMVTYNDEVFLGNFFLQVVAKKLSEENKIRIESCDERESAQWPEEARGIFAGWKRGVIVDFTLTASNGTIKGEDVKIEFQRIIPPPKRESDVDFNYEKPVEKTIYTVTNCTLNGTLVLSKKNNTCPVNEIWVQTQPIGNFTEIIRLSSIDFDIRGLGNKTEMTIVSFGELNGVRGKQRKMLKGWMNSGTTLHLNLGMKTDASIKGEGVELHLVERSRRPFPWR